MSIRRQLEGLDDHSVESLRRLYSDRYTDKSFVKEIAELIGHAAHERVATWLLKYHLEQGGQLGLRSIDEIYRLVDSLEHWEAKLHILQSIPYMPIPSKRREQVESFIRDCLTDDNKLVRAWAYGGFYELASSYADYQAEAAGLFAKALRDEAASVKARVRIVAKKGF
ncbi:MAG: hypothetical protein AAFX56_05170 [Pseudomonadota bacterium]